MLRFVPLNDASYRKMPKHHLFSLSLSSRYAPVSYLVGGPVWHLLQLLSQQAISASLTWLHSDDVSKLTVAVSEQEVSKPKPTMKITRLSTKTAAKEEAPKVETVQTADRKLLYEEKYPELIAAMIQKKTVSMGLKEGFTFIEYYYSRGNKKNNWRVC
mgnify:CR=1 FL=1